MLDGLIKIRLRKVFFFFIPGEISKLFLEEKREKKKGKKRKGDESAIFSMKSRAQ